MAPFFSKPAQMRKRQILMGKSITKDEIYLFNFVLLKKKRSDRIIFFFYINRHELTSWTNAIRLTLWEEKLQGGTINADDIRLKLWEEKFQDSNIAAIRLKTLSRGSYKMCLNSQ
jgi:hypothetical protein